MALGFVTEAHGWVGQRRGICYCAVVAALLICSLSFQASSPRTSLLIFHTRSSELDLSRHMSLLYFHSFLSTSSPLEFCTDIYLYLWEKDICTTAGRISCQRVYAFRLRRCCIGGSLFACVFFGFRGSTSVFLHACFRNIFSPPRRHMRNVFMGSIVRWKILYYYLLTCS